MQQRNTRWDPKQYRRFSTHRLRPALDLLARVPLDSFQEIVDLGCGAGDVTRILAERWPGARVTGVDHSREMLQAARATSSTVQWLEADITDWTPAEPPDLIYANAALHWLDGHHELLPRLFQYLREGGCLAVQMPLSRDLPSHRLMRETLADGGAGGRPLGPPALRLALERRPVLSAATYHALLADRAAAVDIWETEYLQELAGEDPVLRWVQGTGLRPVLNGLADRERATFLAEYGRRLREAYPAGPGGRTLYPFRRLFLVASR